MLLLTEDEVFREVTKIGIKLNSKGSDILLFWVTDQLFGVIPREDLHEEYEDDQHNLFVYEINDPVTATYRSGKQSSIYDATYIVSSNDESKLWELAEALDQAQRQKKKVSSTLALTGKRNPKRKHWHGFETEQRDESTRESTARETNKKRTTVDINIHAKKKNDVEDTGVSKQKNQKKKSMKEKDLTSEKKKQKVQADSSTSQQKRNTTTQEKQKKTEESAAINAGIMQNFAMVSKINEMMKGDNSNLMKDELVVNDNSNLMTSTSLSGAIAKGMTTVIESENPELQIENLKSENEALKLRIAQLETHRCNHPVPGPEVRQYFKDCLAMEWSMGSYQIPLNTGKQAVTESSDFLPVDMDFSSQAGPEDTNVPESDLSIELNSLDYQVMDSSMNASMNVSHSRHTSNAQGSTPEMSPQDRNIPDDLSIGIYGTEQPQYLSMDSSCTGVGRHMWFCQLCNKSFVNNETLQLHIQNQHTSTTSSSCSSHTTPGRKTSAMSTPQKQTSTSSVELFPVLRRSPRHHQRSKRPNDTHAGNLPNVAEGIGSQEPGGSLGVVSANLSPGYGADMTPLLQGKPFLVNRNLLQKNLNKAVKLGASGPAMLLKKLILLLFTTQELADSRGQGFYESKAMDLSKPALNEAKCQACKDYVMAFCHKHKRQLLEIDINHAFTMQVSYARQKLGRREKKGKSTTQ